MAEAAYSEGEWTSADGLTLHFRDYAGPADRTPLLCIPGLTRNCRDFEPVAEAITGSRRVIAIDLRGRGQSDYARDPATYMPLQYVADVIALLDQADVRRVVAMGTSLGGIVIMLLALTAPERISGAVLNDIGPEIESAGIARIADYVGQGRSFPTWMHAARGLREQGGTAYPDFAISDWLRIAKRMMVVGPGGRIAFDYDMKIAEPFHRAEEAPEVDMWPAFRALAGRPVLALRGELSDILSASTLERMTHELAGLQTVTVPRVGHVPTLEEPEAQDAIATLLAKIE